MQSKLITAYLGRCVMALTRGSNGSCPCPVCLVPNNMQSKMHIVHPRRSAGDAQEIVWNKELNRGQKNALLQPLGLRDIEV